MDARALDEDVPARRPASDVSAWVGLAGLGGLSTWLAICRNWAAIADAFALPGPHAPMSGPYAAVAAVVFSGVPMVLWSILVDKAHRRSSTGIDWARPRLLASVIDVSLTKLAGLWATWAGIGFAYCLARWYWQGNYLFAMDVLAAVAPVLFVLSIPYVLWLDRVLIEPRDGAWHFGAMLMGREAWDGAEVRAHWRAWAVKGFFTAFMISILPPGFAALVTLDVDTIAGNPVAMATWGTELLFLIDVQIAMVGYLLTMRPLDAQIRSANPHLSAWLAALICYPPFILMGEGGPLDYHHNTADWAFWLQDHPPVLWLWGCLLISLTAIYAWATVAFGLRFSNLTYRGVLTNGPYVLSRHPAYLSKNAFWWLATMPFLATSGSLVDVIRNTAILALVSAVYYWRARTEEKHLLAEDPRYREYHAWMGRNAPLTKGLGVVARAFSPRGRQLQPAE
ncbi:methyltransferase family protein [Novosphingobium tardum]|uniref:Methyltransferase family protein n=1 Tax=Novosphingobium tardum TaxID=1538021 RepID=A0ABV8RTE9_9SPHN